MSARLQLSDRNSNLQLDDIGNIAELFKKLENVFHEKLTQATKEHQKVSEILTSLLQDEDPHDAAEIEQFIQNRTRGHEFCPIVHSKHAMENSRRLQKEIQRIETEVSSQKSALRNLRKERLREETSLRELSGQLAIIKEIVLEEAVSNSTHNEHSIASGNKKIRKRLANLQVDSARATSANESDHNKRRATEKTGFNRDSKHRVDSKENESVDFWQGTAQNAATVASETSCGVCGQPATSLVERCIVNGQTFHKKCCVCSVCQVRLDRTNFNSVDEALFCKTHFKSAFSRAPKGAASPDRIVTQCVDLIERNGYTQERGIYSPQSPSRKSHAVLQALQNRARDDSVVRHAMRMLREINHAMILPECPISLHSIHVVPCLNSALQYKIRSLERSPACS
eukprot:m.258645 g.258645  ORF g.258645 m.258645 type:complete len:398 (-) comp19648_c0_seq2:1507-2700(-)